MNVLLTGITGFIGSHLAPKLNERGYKVFALLRHSPRIQKIPEYVVPITGDLLDIHSLKKAVRQSQPDVVINTAALTPVRKSFDNPFVYAKTNYIGTMNLVHASLECPILEKFIHASTAEVYKPKMEMLKEEDALFGSTPYGVSKVAADYYVQMAGLCYGLPYIILRPTNTFGRKTENGYFIEKVVTTMMKEKELVLNGTPDVYRDFMYVDDHVNGYLKAIDYKGSQEIFNLSTMRRLSIGQVTKLIKMLLGWEGEIKFGGKPRPNDPISLVLDSTKARKLLGWKDEYALEEGVYKVEKHWSDKL